MTQQILTGSWSEAQKLMASWLTSLQLKSNNVFAFHIEDEMESSLCSGLDLLSLASGTRGIGRAHAMRDRLVRERNPEMQCTMALQDSTVDSCDCLQMQFLNPAVNMRASMAQAAGSFTLLRTVDERGHASARCRSADRFRSTSALAFSSVSFWASACITSRYHSDLQHACRGSSEICTKLCLQHMPQGWLKQL